MPLLTFGQFTPEYFEKDEVLKPTSETELSDMIAAAKSPLCIQGGGTRPVGQPKGDLLTTSGLSGITLYEPGALTMVAKAGTPLAEIEATLDAENQQVAFEPMDHRPLLGTGGIPTIGGVFAANVSGPRRIQCGAARDFLLGVRFVDGQGRVLSNGGRVMKNVTGYDLVKLMAGSRGTLGVISEVSFKVLPKPESVATLVFKDLTSKDTIDVMSGALRSPFDVTGAAYLSGKTILRLEGFSDSVKYRSQRLLNRLSSIGSAALIADEGENARLWVEAKDVRAFSNHNSVWRVSIKPSDSLELLDAMNQMHSYDWMLDWGGGLIWVAVTQDHLLQIASYGDEAKRNDPLEGIRVLHANLQYNVTQLGGHATLVKAPSEAWNGLNAFQPEPAPVAALTQAIRQKFDPKGILNRYLMKGA
ncbi:FAD-binding protein [Roseovarius sp. EL26]|uniref:FAD-binding protein n=1 Tax=Roseovarius sp. EL26 TaxID=2126672 RepID=UPI0020B13AF9|nr:FAD-binding protein [Roseovarius sp. EL26]